MVDTCWVDTEDLVDAVLSAPVGAGVVMVASRSGLGLAGLTDPVTVTALAAAVCRELTPWSGDHRALSAWLVEQSWPLRGLAIDAAQHPGTRWWTAGFDRAAQLALGAENTTFHPSFATTGSGWEVYAQQPSESITTSTALTPVATDQIRSGRHAVAAAGGSDWSPTYPLPQALLPIHADARIIEIAGPEDWNRLTRVHPATRADGRSDDNLRSSSGIDHGPCPDWAATATEYDGVHISFAAVLTGLFVPVTHAGTTTTMWNFDSEMTIWFRQAWNQPLLQSAYPERLELPRCVQGAVVDHITFADRP